MFSDKSLDWESRTLDNKRWVGISSWSAASADIKWHQIKDKYNIPVDLIYSDEEVVPMYRNLAYKDQRSDEDKTKEEENEYIVKDLRKAGEVTRICRHYIQNYLKDGTNLFEFSKKVEDNIQKVLG